MRKLHYHRVDVFTDRAFGGNPLAVFTNGRGLTTETMQAIAKEFNLSETTFVLPREHMVESAGDEAVTITLEEGVGPIPVRIEFAGGRPVFIEMTQPLPVFGPRLED